MTQRLIENDADLRAALASLDPDLPVAVDTEFMRRDSYYPKVALLQISTGDEALLIDPLAVEDLEALRALFRDPAREKVLHSCSEDLEVFERWLGVQPQPLIDTQRAAALLGEAFGLGYRALVQKLLGLELDKGETRSNWLRRPLSESQCHYAAQDVIHLAAVWSRLRERAEASGRLPWILQEGEDLLQALKDREREAYRRMRGIGRLSRRELAALAALYEWREARARSLDRPRGWVLEDKACLAIARAMPGHRQALADLDVLPPSLLRKSAPALLEQVARVRSLPEEALPVAPPAQLTPAQRQKLKSLRTALRERADSLGMPPEVLLSGAEIELLLRQLAGESVSEPARWAGWRSQAVIDPLRALAA